MRIVLGPVGVQVGLSLSESLVSSAEVESYFPDSTRSEQELEICYDGSS